MKKSTEPYLRAVEPQGYADDCCVTATTPQALEQAAEESKNSAGKAGLLLARYKCHLFVNSFAYRRQLNGITASEKILSVGNSFNCLGVSIPAERNAKGGRDPKYI